MARCRCSPRLVLLLAALISAGGCGTTRMSDTARTGTEQLLVSNAIDRAINEMDFSVLADKDVYLDPQYMRGTVDEGYIISSLRQHLLANGSVLKANREDATYVVEARSGAVGTNRHDVLLGVPSFSLPYTGMPGVPSQVPEIPFAKSTHQKGVAKLAVFVYNQQSGLPIWQSGATTITATSRDTWVLGTGPFQRGSIYQGTGFAGSRLMLPFGRERAEKPMHNPVVSVTAQGTFDESRAVQNVASHPVKLAAATTPSVAPRAPATWSPAPPQPPIAKQPDVVSTSWTPYAQPQAAAAPAAANAPISGGNGTGLLYLGNTFGFDGLLPSPGAKK